jgi:uncharacterized membrane protein YagU involved in acid resistance
MSSLESLMTTATAAARPPRAFEAILWGGLTAGVFDAIYATSIWALRGVTPARVWQGVASGLLGREAAVQGGLCTAFLGITIHFFIALTAAAVYVTASRLLPLLRTHAVPCGLAFGLMVWAFMVYVVIPLSRMSRRPSAGPSLGWDLLGAWAIHMLGVGLPIALNARKFLGRG